jgi:hypothetical protein
MLKIILPMSDIEDHQTPDLAESFIQAETGREEKHAGTSAVRQKPGAEQSIQSVSAGWGTAGHGVDREKTAREDISVGEFQLRGRVKEA